MSHHLEGATNYSLSALLLLFAPFHFSLFFSPPTWNFLYNTDWQLLLVLLVLKRCSRYAVRLRGNKEVGHRGMCAMVTQLRESASANTTCEPLPFACAYNFPLSASMCDWTQGCLHESVGVSQRKVKGNEKRKQWERQRITERHLNKQIHFNFTPGPLWPCWCY